VSKCYYRVSHNPQGTGATDITDVISLRSDHGIETRTSKFQFRIGNSNNKYSNYFTFRDSVEIYYGRTLPLDTGDLTLTATVTSVKHNDDVSNDLITVEGVNKAEMVLSRLDSFVYENYTASEIIIHLLNRIIDESNQPTVTTNNVEETTHIIPLYAYNYKKAWEVINEISSSAYTDKGQFIWWIDNDNDLHWKTRPGVLPTTPTFTENVDILDLNFTLAITDVVNAVIFNCGKDLNENAILGMTYNETSITDIGGFKWKYFAWEDVAATLKKEHPEWTNSQLRSEAKQRGMDRANLIVEFAGSPIWKGSFTTRGSTQYLAGDVVYLDIPSLGDYRNEVWTAWTGDDKKLIRIVDVVQHFDKNGWFTTYELREDEDTLAAGI